MQNYMNSQKDKSVSLYGTQVSCGFPSTVDDFCEGVLSLDDLIVKSPASTFFVRSIGDSMSPYIDEGDLLVVDKSITPSNGNVVLAVVFGEFSVKRIHQSTDLLELTPDNPSYKKMLFKDGDDVEIWGVVTTVIKNSLI